jgi:hypothetical protein
MNAAHAATKMTASSFMVCREFMVPLGYEKAGLIFPQEGGQPAQIPLLDLGLMPKRGLLRYILLAGLSLAAGLLALAIAVPIEPQTAPPVIALFSPGLKLAEFLTTPETGKSFAWTFGWFLRIAIVANAAFYFAIFSFFAYLTGRRRGPG